MLSAVSEDVESDRTHEVHLIATYVRKHDREWRHNEDGTMDLPRRSSGASLAGSGVLGASRPIGVSLGAGIDAVPIVEGVDGEGHARTVVADLAERRPLLVDEDDDGRPIVEIDSLPLRISCSTFLVHRA